MRCFADISAINRENKARYSSIIVCITIAQYCTRSVPVSCFIYHCEEAKACDKWSAFVKIELNESFVHLRKRFAFEDYGGFKRRAAEKGIAQLDFLLGVKHKKPNPPELSAFNLTGTKTKLSYNETVTRVQQCYAFHEEDSFKVQGIQDSTTQTQGPDRTLSATTLNSVKMILEGLSRLKTKVMELNPNFIQQIDV